MPDLAMIFVNYHDFTGPSGVHIYHLGRHLEAHAILPVAYVPHDPGSAEVFGPARFKTARYSLPKALMRIRRLRNLGVKVILHAWTPRRNVRRFVGLLSALSSVPYVVHLEDNEHHLAALSASPGKGAGHARANPAAREIARMTAFLGRAAGITCLTEKLVDHCPPHVPRLMIWPGAEEAFFELPLAPDAAARRDLGIAESEFVIAYTGNVHHANIGDMATLYGAIDRLHRRGARIRLLRSGTTIAQCEPMFGADPSRPWLTALGDVPARSLPGVIAAADALVQPGRPDAFNDYRFPSKLTIFFASGRPVILPRANVGRHLADGHHALLLGDGDEADIAGRIEALMADPDLRRRLGENGRAFARAHFAWPDIAARVAHFYRETVARQTARGLFAWTGVRPALRG
jgi:glycosyltransferase involved in cell wall biosynthesis